MLNENQPEMLKEVLNDEFYQWNINYIFEMIGKNLSDKDRGLDYDQEKLS